MMGRLRIALGQGLFLLTLLSSAWSLAGDTDTVEVMKEGGGADVREGRIIADELPGIKMSTDGAEIKIPRAKIALAACLT